MDLFIIRNNLYIYISGFIPIFWPMIHSDEGRWAARVPDAGLGVGCEYQGLSRH